jgi:hypothetical protein
MTDGTPATWTGRVTASWAVLGVAAALFEGIFRLGARALGTIRSGLEPTEWVALASAVVLLVYLEGYCSLQRRFVPQLISRALSLPDARDVTSMLLAPLYALSLIGAERRRRARAWVGLTLILGAVLAVRALPDPWRGIVDAGVAAALAWGTAALLARFFRAIGRPVTR